MKFLKTIVLGTILGLGLFGSSSCSENDGVDPNLTEVYVIDSLVDSTNGLDTTKIGKLWIFTTDSVYINTNGDSTTPQYINNYIVDNDTIIVGISTKYTIMAKNYNLTSSIFGYKLSSIKNNNKTYFFHSN